MTAVQCPEAFILPLIEEGGHFAEKALDVLIPRLFSI